MITDGSVAALVLLSFLTGGWIVSHLVFDPVRQKFNLTVKPHPTRKNK